AYPVGGQAPYGYNVPAQQPVARSKGFVSGLIMVLSSLAMAIAMFLPFLGVDGSEVLSLAALLSRLSEFEASQLDAEVWLFVAIPVVIGLSLLASLLALWRRRNVWAVFSLLFGLVLSGFMGLLMLGASVADDAELAVGSAVPIITVSGLILLIASIVFMATRKLPR
ncbi:MAG TPA: hypothetical protein VD886_18485, partial [Herpetosiphonaceae bacterium]|nr:hypothetical protein [Herpetosiphonaceae bacterium]